MVDVFLPDRAALSTFDRLHQPIQLTINSVYVRIVDSPEPAVRKPGSLATVFRLHTGTYVERRREFHAAMRANRHCIQPSDKISTSPEHGQREREREREGTGGKGELDLICKIQC